MPTSVLALRRLGFAVASVGYRLSSVRGAPRYTHPAQLDDVAAAVQWLRHNATLDGTLPPLDTTRFIALGFSAGAHLAALLALSSSAAAVQGVVSIAAPLSLPTLLTDRPQPPHCPALWRADPFYCGAVPQQVDGMSCCEPLPRLERGSVGGGTARTESTDRARPARVCVPVRGHSRGPLPRMLRRGYMRSSWRRGVAPHLRECHRAADAPAAWSRRLLGRRIAIRRDAREPRDCRRTRREPARAAVPRAQRIGAP